MEGAWRGDRKGQGLGQGLGAHSRASIPCVQGSSPRHTWEPDLCCGATLGITPRPPTATQWILAAPIPTPAYRTTETVSRGCLAPLGDGHPSREPGCPLVPQDPWGSSQPSEVPGKMQGLGWGPGLCIFEELWVTWMLPPTLLCPLTPYTIFQAPRTLPCHTLALTSQGRCS